MNTPSQDKPTAASSACCAPEPAATEGDAASKPSGTRRDWLFTGSATLVIVGYLAHLLLDALSMEVVVVGNFAMGVHHIINTIWWGMLLGVFMVGLLSRVPREFVIATLGPPGAVGIARATLAGVLLDLCSHGILMVAAKLYERGASTGQVIAFLVASPWNSFSLTLILIAMVGIGWTAAFVALSAVVAFVSGLIFEALVRGGRFAPNPNTIDLPHDFHFWTETKNSLRQTSWRPSMLWSTLVNGFRQSRMVMRWILFGVVLAAVVRTMFDTTTFATLFGPTIGGLALTLLGATVLEVCSEGSAPIAGDLFGRAHAPGNAFAFLMGGVSTDYTELLVLREMTGSWRFALMLPLVSLPQIVLLAVILNTFGT